MLSMDHLKNKVILTVAPTGAVTRREDTPNLAHSPKEIADEVFKCYQAGAAIAHIHVRENDGTPSMNIEKFRETVTLIRERCDIVINLTSSGGIGLNEDDRIRPFVELLPELATFDAGTMNWRHETVFDNNPKFLERLGTEMGKVNVKPEIEVFDAGMLYNALYYVKKGILKEPLHVQFVLGAPGGIAATVENLIFLKGLLPENTTWGAFGVGRMSVPIMMTTLALGGHLRVGMEDNIFIQKGVLAKSNVEFVEQAKRLVKEVGKELATPDEAREILSLKSVIQHN
ncbi:3-keto-5-aminohexanoate cleavage protein [Bacillus sp. OK048]|uniref:3-keto-5-aminohexanoate cleavage protein n=1 Tax=Bacillus sp. OK048 TaxID=1882761 RepID=UPI0008829445|nr:3-keto-5-aminohexanoate cleavage protein [Bacillus sp. OK048]SDM87333.1 3-keto-5-aminohexanoate cleavage enzyme [Bacillus sp. OK048]